MSFATDAPPPEACAPLMPILDAVIAEPGALPRIRKEEILLTAAAARGSAACVASRARALRELGVSAADVEAIAAGRHAACRAGADAAILDFCRKLCLDPTGIGRGDVARLREAGLGEESILEAVLLAACSTLLCILAAGLPAASESGPAVGPAADFSPASPEERQGPYLSALERTPEELPALAALQKRFGFIPRLYRAQTLKPGAIEAEARILEDLVFGPTSLGRAQKEAILVAFSAAGRNTYCATLHGRVLQMTGVSAEAVERIAADPGTSDLPEAEKALVDAARRLATGSTGPGSADVEGLRRHGWTQEQILESVALAALAGFLNTVQMGLGVPPDFRPKRDFLTDPPEGLNLSGSLVRPTEDERRPFAPVQDPDGPLVAAARVGDMTAFEALVRRHQGRVYRTLMGITGNAEDAKDGAQSVFLKVFRKLGDFGSEALFSTWLHRIAVNEGLERLRSRKPTESLEEDREEDFRPVRLDPWIEDPETRFARSEMKRLVEEALGRLPAPYRTALLLRDIQELSGAEAAAVLGIPLPTLKTRLLRGRLMLREALAGHFAAPLSPASA